MTDVTEKVEIEWQSGGHESFDEILFKLGTSCTPCEAGEDEGHEHGTTIGAFICADNHTIMTFNDTRFTTKKEGIIIFLILKF